MKNIFSEIQGLRLLLKKKGENKQTQDRNVSMYVHPR